MSSLDLAFRGMRYPRDIILQCVRWYASYSLSYRNLEEMMEERGLFDLSHTTIYRWTRKIIPVLNLLVRKRKWTVSPSWRMDETYILINGQWYYYYRAVDKNGLTIDFLLSKRRDRVAAMRFFNKAFKQHGFPKTVVMDKSGSNKAAIGKIIKDKHITINVRQVKYLNNIVEQDHRAIKRMVRPMLGFKSFNSARNMLTGIEIMHMLRKDQFNIPNSKNMSIFQRFSAIVA